MEYTIDFDGTFYNVRVRRHINVLSLFKIPYWSIIGMYWNLSEAEEIFKRLPEQ